MSPLPEIRAAGAMPVNSGKPFLAMTQGEPAGVGPEICLSVLRKPAVLALCRPVLVGNLAVLESVGRLLDLPPPRTVLSDEEFRSIEDPRTIDTPAVVDCGGSLGSIRPGVSSAEGGLAAYRCIEFAALETRAGRFDGMVTAPVDKKALDSAGVQGPGHTEILARLTDCADYALMLYGGGFAVGFVTCHIPLKEVPKALTREGILRVIRLTARTLLEIEGRDPRIGILGLNPHAGEEGLLGTEEIEAVRPAVEEALREGLLVEGPLPPDTAFLPRTRERFDGYVALYHDQGSIPFKMSAFREGVNLTMGLPIVRTSVDHGTAYDLAWKGSADSSSLEAAVRLAVRLVEARRRGIAKAGEEAGTLRQ